MQGSDEPGRRYYECIECQTRIIAEHYRADCPDCDGRLRNIAVPRE